MRIALVWDFSVEPLQLYGWNDGLSAALQTLAQKYNHIVKVIPGNDVNEIYATIEAFMPDVILGWGSLDRPSFAGLRQFGKPTALCFAGGPTHDPQSTSFDLFFVENDMYVKEFKEQGLNVIKAFGTNDYLFKPLVTKKTWDAVFPASFAKWKRHELFAPVAKNKGLAFGKIQQNEIDCYKMCVQHGCTVMPEVPYHVVPYLINQSKATLITSLWGSQRAILESMACNVPVIVMEDSITSVEFVKDSGIGFVAKPNIDDIAAKLELALKAEPDGRRYVLDKYSAEGYADKLHKGLTSI